MQGVSESWNQFKGYDQQENAKVFFLKTNRIEKQNKTESTTSLYQKPLLSIKYVCTELWHKMQLVAQAQCDQEGPPLERYHLLFDNR